MKSFVASTSQVTTYRPSIPKHLPRVSELALHISLTKMSPEARNALLQAGEKGIRAAIAT